MIACKKSIRLFAIFVCIVATALFLPNPHAFGFETNADFGDVPVGQSYKSTVTITASSTDNFFLTGLTLEKKDASDFVLSNFTKEEQGNLPAILNEASSLLTEYIYSNELTDQTRKIVEERLLKWKVERPEAYGRRYVLTFSATEVATAQARAKPVTKPVPRPEMVAPRPRPVPRPEMIPPRAPPKRK